MVIAVTLPPPVESGKLQKQNSFNEKFHYWETTFYKIWKSLLSWLFFQQVLQILWAPVEGRQQLWLCELQKRIWLSWKQWIKSLTAWKTQGGLLIKLLHLLVWGKGKIWPYSALSIVTKKSPCGPKVVSNLFQCCLKVVRQKLCQWCPKVAPRGPKVFSVGHKWYQVVSNWQRGKKYKEWQRVLVQWSGAELKENSKPVVMRFSGMRLGSQVEVFQLSLI